MCVCALCPSLKTGKVVIVLQGRYAGRKAVIVKTFDDGAVEGRDRKFNVALVAGIDRYPRKITKSMGTKKQAKRSSVKPFIKYINYSHIMPTRYQVDVSDSLTAALTSGGNTLAEPEAIHTARKAVKEIFEQRYKSQASVARTSKTERYATGVSYFFKKLRF